MTNESDQSHTIHTVPNMQTTPTTESLIGLEQPNRCHGITKQRTRCQRRRCWQNNFCQKHGAPILDTCTVCTEPAYINNLCLPHSSRYQTHGHPLAGGTAKGESAQWLKHQLTHADRTRCWNWPYAKGSSGHGQIKINKRTRPAHQIAMIWDNRPCPPDKYQGNHKCDNPRCVNPDHIYWGTKRDNERDMVHAGTHTRGSRNALAKLTPQQADEARASTEPHSVIARRFNVSAAAISRIRNGDAYVF